uniref:Ribosomal protein S2 n=1 Tax=Eukaryota sp. BB2 TaxID=1949062 RepID=A0A1W5QGC8_9EUKA|nr:ribosomal protein S2 [Eukaryota sp. BB2]AQL10472.1 ribosomal protein S2 [Eukaryota sp. BB2]
MISSLFTQLVHLGVHVGTPKFQWNPNLSLYLLGKKNHTFIFDIRYTLLFLRKALNFVRFLSKSHGILLFVNCDFDTSPFTYLIKMIARRCNQPVISSNWMSGFLTNWRHVVKKIINSLLLSRNKGKNKQKTGNIRAIFIKILYLTSHRRADVLLQDHIKTLQKYYKFFFFFVHFKLTKRIPDAMVLFNSSRSKLPINEFRSLRLPIISTIDSDSMHQHIAYPITSNDDSVVGNAFYCHLFCRAYSEGRFLKLLNFYPRLKRLGQNKSRRFRLLRKKYRRKRFRIRSTTQEILNYVIKRRLNKIVRKRKKRWTTRLVKKRKIPLNRIPFSK